MASVHIDDYSDGQAELLAYLGSHRHDHVRAGGMTPAEVEAKVDTVEPEIMGKVKITLVLSTIRRHPETQALEFALRLVSPREPHDGVARLPDLRDSNDPAARQLYLEKLRRKHLTEDVKLSCTGPGRIAVEHLTRTAGLFERIPQQKMHLIKEFAGAFLVWKTNGRMRMICDARPSNARLDTSRLPAYSLPLIEVIRQVMANVASGGEPFFVLSTDWRNAFFQVELVERLKAYCVHELRDEQNAAFFVWLNTLAMGLTISPYIMSALSWATILCPHGERSVPGLDTSKLPRGHPDDPSWQVFPQWLPLECGGGIFVIIDNIFIVTRRQETADALLERIVRNAHTWRLAFKLKCFTGRNYEGYHDIPPAIKVDIVRRECFHVMQPGDVTNEGVTFCGVRWRPDSYFVEVDPERDGAVGPHQYISGSTWRGPRRPLMAILARLGWHRRVSVPNGLDDALGEAVHRLAQMAVPAVAAESAAWDEEVIIDDRNLITALLAAWEERRTCASRPCSYQPESDRFEYMLQCATDASTSHALVAAVVLDDQGNGLRHAVLPFAHLPPRDDYAVAHRELQGVILGVKACKAYARSCGRGLDLITLACDNQNVIAWVSSKRHYGAVVPDLLRELRRALLADRHRTRLYMVFVGTAANVADPYSRGESCSEGEPAPVAARRRLTRDVLQAAQSSALGMWRISGGLVGQEDRRRLREP
jgi:hypothetical protein